MLSKITEEFFLILLDASFFSFYLQYRREGLAALDTALPQLLSAAAATAAITQMRLEHASSRYRNRCNQAKCGCYPSTAAAKPFGAVCVVPKN